MKIRKTTDEKGKETIGIEVDGVWTDDLNHELSRKLTGTTGEIGDGIFNRSFTNFSFGQYNWELTLPPWKHLTVEKIAGELSRRIEDVKKWVAECKAKAKVETAEILTVKHAWEYGTAKEIAGELSRRIEEVEKWIAKCKAEVETAEILTVKQAIKSNNKQTNKGDRTMKKELRKNILLSAIRTAEEMLISDQWDAATAQLYLVDCLSLFDGAKEQTEK